MYFAADAVLKVLAEERLEQFADRIQTRIVEGKPAGVKSSHAGNQQNKYDSFFQNHAQSFQAFPKHSGESCLELCCNSVRVVFLQVWLTNLMCSSLLRKAPRFMSVANTQIHASDAQLKKDAKKMGAFVDMLHEEMSYECALVTHFDWVARNMFNL